MGKAEEIWDEIRRGGAGAIRRLVTLGASEDQWLEFKRGAPSKDILSRNASAFANTEGGVIVWGIEAPSPRTDRAETPSECAIASAEEFRTQLEHMTSAACDPPVPGVVHMTVPVDGGPAGFVATYIPASPAAPHRDKDQVYRVRIGSNTLPMPHALFAAYFGKRPAPSLSLVVAVTALDKPDRHFARAQFEFLVQNSGDGPLSDMFFSAVRVGGWYPSEHAPEWEAGDAQEHAIYKRADESTRPFSFSLFTHQHYRVAPRGVAAVAKLTVFFHRGGGSPASEFEGVVGAVGSGRVNWRLCVVPPMPTLIDGKEMAGDNVANRSTYGMQLRADLLVGGEFLHHATARLQSDHGVRRGGA